MKIAHNQAIKLPNAINTETTSIFIAESQPLSRIKIEKFFTFNRDADPYACLISQT